MVTENVKILFNDKRIYAQSLPCQHFQDSRQDSKDSLDKPPYANFVRRSTPHPKRQSFGQGKEFVRLSDSQTTRRLTFSNQVTDGTISGEDFLLVI